MPDTATRVALLELASEFEEYGAERVQKQLRGDEYGSGLHNAYQSVVETLRMKADYS